MALLSIIIVFLWTGNNHNTFPRVMLKERKSGFRFFTSFLVMSWLECRMNYSMAFPFVSTAFFAKKKAPVSMKNASVTVITTVV